MQSWSSSHEAEEFRRLALQQKVTLDRLFILCRATETPLTLDYAPARDQRTAVPEIYVRVGGVGVGWFGADGLELTGAIAEWIGRLERAMADVGSG